MRPLRSVYVQFVSFCILVSIVVTLLISNIPTQQDVCNCGEATAVRDAHVLQHDQFHSSLRVEEEEGDGKRKLALLVPFRDRFDELLQFVPHMAAFLGKQRIAFRIFILNQSDRYRFNRASLINVGFLQVRDRFDYIAMHDVDLLPLNNNLRYEYPQGGPLHISGPEFHPKYHYPSFIGGILLLCVEHYQQLNGMSNRYWGWGLEDDEFYVRIKEAGFVIHRPHNITTGPEGTFLHVHDRVHRRRDTAKCFNQREVTRKRDRETGLSTLQYSLRSRKELTIDGVPLTVLNIDLTCDKTQTPWCECDPKTEPTAAATKPKSKKQSSLK